MKDDIYDQSRPPEEFRFDGRVASVFPDMINRSIPAYQGLLQLIASLGRGYLRENGLAYDLGCATGGAALALRPYLPPGARLIAVDLSAPMVERLNNLIEGHGWTNLTAEQGDLLHWSFRPAQLMILNFTLQFIDKRERDGLLKTIFDHLEPGGALLLAEKTDRPEWVSWHEDFKELQGYSRLAIAQKRSALENVMKLDSEAVLEGRLRRAGFRQIHNYFRALQFQGWLAEKD